MKGKLRSRKREEAVTLTDIPNVGPAIARDLRLLGIDEPEQLKGLDPFLLYEELNRRTGKRHDPCVIDVFIAAVRFIEGAPARPWWEYTAERKETLQKSQAAGSASAGHCPA